jgi:C4-dicarboxylate-specific signal transduction histidine kinase
MRRRAPVHCVPAEFANHVREAVMRLALLLAACCVLVAPPTIAAEARDVLVLYANDRFLPAYVDVDRGLREVLANSKGKDAEIFAEYLNRPAFSGPAFEQIFAGYLRDKYVIRPPGVIVAVGRPVVDFLLRHRAQLFPAVPVVHLGVDKSYVLSVSPLPADVFGVPVVSDFGGTIQLALLWHPHARRLVVVTGASPGDRAFESQVREDLARIELHIPVEFLAGLPTDAVEKRLRALGGGDIVFTPGYFLDGAGRAFAPRESAALMAAASGAPVYGPFETYIGTGVVGGRMPAYIEMGREAGKAAEAVLDGTRPAEIRLPASIPSPVQVDWRQVRRWSIDQNDIPADAIVHFREPTFWEAYRKEATAVVIAFLLQAGLIGALLIERRRRRRAAAALEDSEKRMSLAAHAARLSMWMWDLTHDSIWATGKLRQRAGLSKETPVSFDQILQTIHPADRDGFDRAVRQAAATDEELDVEYRIVAPDGEVRWFAARGHAATSEGQCLTGVKMDITARKIAELQAERDRSALTRMSRVSMMGQLSAAIAHQLNQPLAAILGNAEAARKMLGREHLDLAELRAICDDIVTEDNRAAEVIRRLGALYKRGEMEFAPLDLNELVRETLDLVRTELMNRHVAPVAELAPSLPSIEGGRVQLQQALLNLILNAADAMSEVAVAERSLTVRTEMDGADVRLCVVDRGTGIDPGDIRKVFDAFWSTKAGGIGVGLAICQSIVKAHRGTLAATNNPEGGATFCVVLPVRQPAIGR